MNNSIVEDAIEIQLNEWLVKMCDTAVVEKDTEFINAFNRRFKRFKFLFIDE